MGYKTETYGHRQQYVVCQREGSRGRGGLIYADGRWFDFRLWAHSAVHRSCVIEMDP